MTSGSTRPRLTRGLLHVPCARPESVSASTVATPEDPRRGAATEPMRGCGAGGQASYLDDDAGRLGEVPERHAEQADERRLGLVGLGAAGAQDAATCKESASLFQRPSRRFGTGTGTGTQLGICPNRLYRVQTNPPFTPALLLASPAPSVMGSRLPSGAHRGPADSDRPLRRGLCPPCLQLWGRQL